MKLLASPGSIHRLSVPGRPCCFSSKTATELTHHCTLVTVRQPVRVQVTLIGSTLDPLEVERTKVRLLLENIAPGSAAANGL